MKTLLLSAACAALAAFAVAPRASAQGPVREGLRRTGEVAAEGTRRVAEGTGQVLRGAGRAAAGVAQGAADAGRAVVGGTARGIRAGVDAVTPVIPWQARADANLQAGDRGRDARWRFNWYNGEWWYYSPEERWMYHRDGDWNEFAQDSFTPNPQFAGEYATGYRGVEGSGQYAPEQYGEGGYWQGPAERLFVDRYGREYICENGRRVYVNTQQTFDQQGQPYGAAYRGEEGQQFYGDEGPMTPTPGIPTEAGVQGQVDQQGQAGVQGQVDQQGQTGVQGQAGAEAQTQPPAAATPQTPTPPQSGTPGAGELPAEAPRELQQQSTQPTSGAIEGDLPRQ